MRKDTPHVIAHSPLQLATASVVDCTLKTGGAVGCPPLVVRRPLLEHELSNLLGNCPESRRLKYGFPAYTGLRRNELADVRWGDLHLDSVIPYIQLRPEQTKNR